MYVLRTPLVKLSLVTLCKRVEKGAFIIFIPIVLSRQTHTTCVFITIRVKVILNLTRLVMAPPYRRGAFFEGRDLSFEHSEKEISPSKKALPLRAGEFNTVP